MCYPLITIAFMISYHFSSKRNSRIAINLENAPVSLKNLKDSLRKLGKGILEVADLSNLIIVLENTESEWKLILTNLLKWVRATYMASDFIRHDLLKGEPDFFKVYWVR